MAEPEELILTTAFGDSKEAAVLLAAQPEELEEEFGAQRAFALKLKNNEGIIVEEISHPIIDSWCSRSKKAYCSSDRGHIMTYQNGNWNREKVTGKEIEFKAIWGFSGLKAPDDTVFLGSDESLFILDKGIWNEHPMPQPVEMVSRLHGLSSDEVYICTDDGLLCWNGTELIKKEGPDDDLRGVIVISEQEILVTGDRLHLWSDEEGWKKLDSPGEEDHTLAICPFGDDIFIGTLNGVVRYRNGGMEMVTSEFCNILADVGDAIIASGDEAYLFEDGQWKRLRLPSVGFMEKIDG